MDLISYIDTPVQQIIVEDSAGLDITIPDTQGWTVRDIPVAIRNPLLLPIKYDDEFRFIPEYTVENAECHIVGVARENSENIVDIFNDGSCKSLYKFDGNLEDSADGSTATVSGRAIYKLGMFDGGFFFNSHTKVKTTAGQPGNMAISFWFKFNNPIGTDCLLSQTSTINGAVKDTISVSKDDNLIELSLRKASGRTTTIMTEELEAEEWYHMVINIQVRPEKAQVVFLNGVRVTRKYIDTPDTFDNTLYLGGYVTNNRKVADNIHIDQVRVFDRILTQDEALKLIRE